MYTKVEERSYGDGCPPKQPQFQVTHASALPGSASKNNNRPWVSKPECRRLVIQTELVFLFSPQKENYKWMRRIQLRLSFKYFSFSHTQKPQLIRLPWVLHQWPKRPERPNAKTFSTDLLFEPKGMLKKLVSTWCCIFRLRTVWTLDRELHQMRLFVQYEAETGNSQSCLGFCIWLKLFLF